MIDEIIKKLTMQKADRQLITDKDATLSSGSFLMMISKISQLLTINNSIKIDKVALYLPHSAIAIASIYSVLYCNGCYIPLQIQDSIERLKKIVNNCNITIIVGIGNKPTWCKNTIRWVNIDSSILDTITATPLAVKKISKLTSIATILHTSGSTGEPKGICISHAAIANFIEWSIAEFRLSEKDKIASLSSFCFDLSFFDIFAAIKAGSQLTMVPDNCKMFPIELTKHLSLHNISVFYTVPSMLVYWAYKGKIKNKLLPKLRLILFAGEVMPKKHLTTLTNILSDTTFYNLFVPTETNVCCSWKVNTGLSQTHGVPIGKPACGNILKLTKDYELIVKGPTLATGYIINGKIKFIIGKDGWYHTGDICCVDASGNYIFKGRKDRMLKISGYRVEPLEIEKALTRHQYIYECAVVSHNDSTYGTQMVLFFSALKTLKEGEIKKLLKTNLPSYMIPKDIKQLNTLPHLSNGKIDLFLLKTKAKQLLNCNHQKDKK